MHVNDGIPIDLNYWIKFTQFMIWSFVAIIILLFFFLFAYFGSVEKTSSDVKYSFKLISSTKQLRTNNTYYRIVDKQDLTSTLNTMDMIYSLDKWNLASPSAKNFPTHQCVLALNSASQSFNVKNYLLNDEWTCARLILPFWCSTASENYLSWRSLFEFSPANSSQSMKRRLED